MNTTTNSNRCVIVSAADITNYSRIKSFLSSDDFFIYCDAGLKHQKELGFEPDLIIGDFDSFDKPDTTTPVIQLPCKKDDTDTFYAVKEAIKQGFTDFILLGSIGNRLDHSLCNISALLYLYKKGLNACIIDDYSHMQIAGKNTLYIEETYSFFSLMNINGTAKGVSIKNAHYPLKNATIKADYQYAISNQVNKETRAEVTVKKGELLLIKVW